MTGHGRDPERTLAGRIARTFSRRRIAVPGLFALLALVTLAAAHSAARQPRTEVLLHKSVGPRPALASGSSAQSTPRHARGVARAQLSKPTTQRHPNVLRLTRAHSAVFDARKLHGRIVRRERPEHAPPGFAGESEAAVAPASAALPQTLSKVQMVSGPSAPAPSPSITFDGLDFASWGAGHPPDTNGDVGPSHYIQTVNSSIGIYDKSTGARVAAFTFNAFMSQGSFGNLCDTNNFGDPVVLYDSLEDRWFISDFAFRLDASGNVVNPPGAFQCFAVSKTGDPVSGGWNFYSIAAPGALNDYPKFGIWPDGIYMSANMFGYSAGGSFVSPHVWAINKAQMYANEPSVQVADFAAPSSDFSLLPSNARLQTGTPPAGSPNYFASVWQFLNVVSVYKFKVDWDKISTSTFSGPFNSSTSNWWEQLASANQTAPTPGNRNDELYARLMMQNQYTNIGGVESLWDSHTVGLGNPGAANLTATQSAVRYYQTKVTGGTVEAAPTQAWTYSPADTLWRYMPSVAADRLGDMAIGYSASNATTNPSLRYAGRLAGDPANSITLDDQTLFAGTGSQTGNCGSSTCTRWGDYSAMSLDPDGCTFWYTNEYYAVNGLNDLTRVGAFKLNPACTPVGNGTLSGTVTDGTSPLSGATVKLGSRSTTTNGSGQYSFTVPAGTYPALNVSKAGFDPASAAAIPVPDGGTATRDFALSAAAQSGCFADNTQNTFQRGVPSNCDLVTSPGNVTLANPNSVDQQNTNVTTSGFGFNSTSWAGQTFTPAVSGRATRVDVDLFCSGCTGTTPDITVSIRSTTGTTPVPTGADLATATIAGFNSGAGGFFAANFASPVTLTAGTRYAIVFRANSNPSAGTYAYVVSSANPYTAGQRVTSSTSGSSWAADTTSGGRDLGFAVYMNSGYASAGTFVSSLKDANPAAGRSPNWTTLSWSATTPAGTAVRFQVAASNSATGPFAFVGPDGTAATFFTTSGASLSQFNGSRYLEYKAFLSTTNGAVTPTLSSVEVCFADVAPTSSTSLAVDPANGAYGGTTPLSATLSSGASGVSGKSVAFTLNGSSVGTATTNSSGVATLSGVSLAGINAGSYPSAVGASFAGDSSYDPSNNSGSLTVSKADQTISFGTLGDKLATDPPFTIGATGGGSGNPVVFSTGSTACSISGTTVTILGNGICVIDANQAGDSNYNAASQVTRSFNIASASQTIDFPAIGDFSWSGGSATLAATASSGLAVSYSIVSGPCSVTGNLLTASHAGSCVVAADQAGNSQYAAAPQVTRTATVLKADQTINVTTHAPSSGVFGTGFSVAATGGGSGNPVTLSSAGACSNTGSSFTMTSGTGTCSVKYDQGGSSDYNAAPQVVESVTAQKANQTITVTTHAPPNAAYNSSFGVAATAPGGTVGFSSSGSCSNTGAIFTITSGTGTCSVKYDQGGSTDYNAAPQVTESVTAQKASQMITVTLHAPTSAVYNTGFSVAASGGGSGNPVTFSSGGTCTSTGDTFTMTSGTGTCSVKFDQAGNSNYEAAPQATESVTAQKASQSITFGPLADKTYGDPDFTVSGTASSGLAPSFTAGGQCTVSGSLVHLTGPGSCTITAHQAGDSNYDAAPDVARTFQVASAETVSQITAIDATCAQFSGGIAATLGSASYTSKSGVIKKITPNKLVYWVKLTLGVGAQHVVVNQSITTGNFVEQLALGAGSTVLNTTCGKVKGATVTAGSGGSVAANFTTAAAGTYYVAVRYLASSVNGHVEPTPSTIGYAFSTAGVGGSTTNVSFVKAAAASRRVSPAPAHFSWLRR